MAPDSYLRYIPYINLLMNPKNNKFIDNPSRDRIKSNSSLVSISWSPSCSSILSRALVSVPASTLVKYTNEDLQRAIKLALESFFQGQKHGQAQAVAALALVLALT